MHGHNWERVAGCAGIVAVLAFVVPGFVGTGRPPTPSDTDSVYKAILLAHHSAIMRQVWLLAFGAVMMLWLGSGVQSFIHRHDERLASLASLIFGLFVMAAGLLGASAAVEGGLVYRVTGETSPAPVVRLGYDIFSFLGNDSLAMVTMLGAAVVAVAALAAHAMSRAVGYVSVVTAAVNLATSLTVFTTKGSFSLEGSFTDIGQIVTMVWLLALSVDLIRPTKAPAVAPIVSTPDAALRDRRHAV